MNERKKIYLLVGHPDPNSFSAAMAEAYERGATAAGFDIRVQSLGMMNFDPVLHKGYNEIQPLEADLVQSQENIEWCDHWVIVHPLWWGSAPAILKGYFDRLLLPGFGFKYQDDKAFPEKLLKGRTARILLMSDTPGFWLRWVYGAGWIKTLKNQILEFCGISPVKINHFNVLRSSTEERRQRWLSDAEKLGLGGF